MRSSPAAEEWASVPRCIGLRQRVQESRSGLPKLAAAGFTAVRGVNRPKRTIIWRGTPDSLSPGGPLIVRARTGGQYYLFSARELEPAAQSRVVLITEGVPTADGMVRLNQRLLVFGKDCLL